MYDAKGRTRADRAHPRARAPARPRTRAYTCICVYPRIEFGSMRTDRFHRLKVRPRLYRFSTPRTRRNENRSEYRKRIEIDRKWSRAARPLSPQLRHNDHDCTRTGTQIRYIHVGDWVDSLRLATAVPMDSCACTFFRRVDASINARVTFRG